MARKSKMTMALAITGALCVVFGIVLVLALVFTMFFGNNLAAAPSKVGERMQLQKMVARKGWSSGDWYGGQYEGRPFALTYVSQKVRVHRVDSGSRAGAVPTLRIAVPVFREGGQAIDVRRTVQNGRKFASFEEAYPKQKGVEQLGGVAKDALYQFAQQQGALRVKDWAGHPRQTMPAELGFQGSWVVYHDYLDRDTDAPNDVIWAKVAALHKVAGALESGQ